VRARGTAAPISIVIPTLGRDSLTRLIGALRPQLPIDGGVELIVVDDRREAAISLPVPTAVRVLTSGGTGPAAARNAGWRAARGEWVVFLDDDVVPSPDWLEALEADLRDMPAIAGGVQGRVVVPPGHGRPDDWQQETAGLAAADWITADMAYRREALVGVGGFDERFPRAYREDVELAYRVRRAGWTLVRGRRRVEHPPRPASAWVSVRRQWGNADDALLRRMYGPGWHDLLGAPRGRRRWHAAGTAAGLAAASAGAAALLADRGTLSRRVLGAIASAGGAVWVGSVAEFAAHRLRRAPGELRHPLALVATSVVIPPTATAAWCSGWWRQRGSRPFPVIRHAETPKRGAATGADVPVGDAWAEREPAVRP
jgi:cellulose synthase/poly-beta-1,6-N-acetylglucosamine synthase-like glycosyltransferase